MISLILISNSSLELSTYTSESWQEQKQKQKQKHCRTPHALFHNFKFIHPCTFSMWLAGMVAIFKPDLTTSNGKIDIWKFLFNFGSELMLIVDVCFPLVLVLAHRYFYVYIYFIYNNCSCSAFSNITNFYSVTCCMYNQSYCGCELGMSLSWVVFNIYMYIKIRHKNITQTTPYYMSTPYTTPNKMNPITRKNMSKSGFCWQQHTMTNTWKTHCKDYRL